MGVYGIMYVFDIEIHVNIFECDNIDRRASYSRGGSIKLYVHIQLYWVSLSLFHLELMTGHVGNDDHDIQFTSHVICFKVFVAQKSYASCIQHIFPHTCIQLYMEYFT